MLLELRVKNLTLIKEEEVLFTDGLNILTGETGAGKSIIIGSVSLALGAKADRDLVRVGEDFALIELVFSIDNPLQEEKLRSMGIEPEDGTILIKRKIYPGRSLCSICGESVTLKQLRELGGCLIDIYGQRENARLLSRDAQRAIIDEFAGQEAQALLEQAGAYSHAYTLSKQAFEATNMDQSARLREMDLLAFEVNEIESAFLKEGEEEELEARHKKLSGFQKIQEAVFQAQQLIGSEEGSALEFTGRAARLLGQVQGMDEELDAIGSELSSVDSLLGDLCRALSDYAEDLTFDPAEYEEICERLDLIHRLQDKYGATTKKVLASLEEKKARLNELTNLDKMREIRQKEMEEARRNLQNVCTKLTVVRQSAAADFSKRMTKELLDLNFNQVEFEVDVTTNEASCGAHGCDEISFLISMNPGEPPRPLEQIASGGELSRIMLALKTVFAGKDDIHSFIFDEIDTGISGQTAWKVARKLGRIAKDHQILCITHLPQIAAMEQSHFLIEKNTQDGRTQTHILRLDEEESTRELGRMMGGEQITALTLKNAAEMKEMARKSAEFSME